jgi:hypothetical protein
LVKESNSSNKLKYFRCNSFKIDCDREKEIEEKVENRKSNVKEEENDDYVFYWDVHKTLTY